MIYIIGQQVKKLLDMESCIKLTREILSALSKNEASQTLRTVMRLEKRNVLG